MVSGLAVVAGLSTGVLSPATPLRAQEATPDARPAAMSASLHVTVARSLARDGAGALAPLVTDAWVQQAKLTAADGAVGDLLGVSVALDGDTALVGALQADVGGSVNQGAAYVFTRTGGVWSEQQKLTAVDGAGNDFFGRSVALEGDTALVGTPGTDVGANVDQGAAYVFIRSGDVWSEQRKLTASDGEGNDLFGHSVALDGDTALVGAMGADAGDNESQGAVYVFARSGDVWSDQQKLTTAAGAAGDLFGRSVALDGDTALVGAPQADVDGNVDQGAAYMFIRSGDIWSDQQKLTAADGAASDDFGRSVALDGDTALVGAPQADVGGNVDQGAAYVFTRSGDVWSDQQKLTAAGGARDDVFGTWVSLDGDTALVGAFAADVGGTVDQGAAYVFTRSGGVWSAQQKLTAAHGARDDNFGISVALDGDTALVGATGTLAVAGGAVTPGAVYVFTLEEPAFDFEPSALDFGEAGVGSTSDAMTATLQNAGTAAATGLTVTAPGNGFAVETSTCSDTLAPGDSCEISVTFTPPATGPASATLTVESAEGATATLTLRGTGVAPALTFEPTRLDFGEVDGGTTSAAMTATLRNTGSVAASDLTFSALAHGFSADTSACGARLDAGARCEIRVTFTPVAAGPANATLTVESVEEATAALTLTGAGVLRYDFAEGATGFFTTTLGLFNPDREATANVEVTLLPEAGDRIVLPITLPPFGRESLDVNAVVETPTGVAAIVRSDRPIAPLRQVSWDDRVYGSTLESGALGPSRTHYFAQGATTLWDMFYLFSNDTDTDAPVTIEYLRDVGEPVVQQVIVPARSRQTVWVNDVPRMALARAGAIITSAVPIAAERSMYRKWPGWPAGASSRGTHAPDDTWYFAEGATDFFDSYLVLMNPDPAREATVDVRYDVSDGQTITKTHVVPPRSRRTIRVEAEGLGLINQLTAMTVGASVPIVAERAAGWGPLSVLLPIPLLWYETAASVGSSAPGTVWAVGEAWTGGPAAEDAYVLVANTAADPGQVRVTLVYDDGSSEAQDVPMAGHGRVTLLLGALFPASDGRRFSVLVESLGGDTAVPIVVDVSRYQSTDARFANAGGSTTATRIR